jgi:hypothetical protein
MRVNILFSSTYRSGARPECTGVGGVLAPVLRRQSATHRSSKSFKTLEKHAYSGHSGPCALSVSEEGPGQQSNRFESRRKRGSRRVNQR